MAMNNKDKNDLENIALAALNGNHGELANGFRVNSPKRGQLAAVYWSANDPANEIEIALALIRLTDAYPLAFVQAWFDLQRRNHPNPCAIHKHHSDWPIIGLSYTQAIDFLKQLRNLRKGILDASQAALVTQSQATQTPAQARMAYLKAQREALRPTRPRAVIDLVKAAGIDIQPWYVRQDGSAAEAPRSNPAYCYNWVFGGGDEPTLACIWHEMIEITDDALKMPVNVRELASRLESVAADTTQPTTNRNRARKQATRARQFDTLIAASNGGTIRTIVLEGNMRRDADLGEEASQVRLRHLDPLEWLVESYDTDSGACVIRRSNTAAPSAAMPAQNSVAAPSTPEEEDRYADQHDLAAGTDTPETAMTTSTVTRRDAEVRAKVQERSAGHCEYCNTPGFLLADGRLYVETHHVQPLSEHGVDRVWNVAALCPSHHREAHHGARKAEIRATLERHLAVLYPDRAVR